MRRIKDFTNIKEFVNFITPFYPGLTIKEYKITEIEQALFHTFIKLIGRILYFSPDHMKNFLKDYLLLFEITNIKEIILGLITGMTYKEKSSRVNTLVEEYLDHQDFITGLLEVSSLEEVQLYLSKTKYNKAIREGLLHFKKNDEIFVLEAFLDQIYYLNFTQKLANYAKKEKEMIGLYILHLVEIYNLRMIYRGIRNKIDKKLLGQFLIKNYLFLNQSKIQVLLNQKNEDAFFDKVEEFLLGSNKLKELNIPLRINKDHFIWSLTGIYQDYYFKKYKLVIDDIEYSTIYRILELIMKKDKEIKFHLMPNIIRIIHDKYERLEKQFENL